jgi:L-serine dehydratase
MIVSIFNDVIGPVMRGPSSSHCAAALRIGRLARDLMDGVIRDVLVEFAPDGSLVTTHASQGSDMGLFAGLMGWDATDDRLPTAAEAIRASGVTTEIAIRDIGATHPNTYRLTLSNSRGTHSLTAISTGGGIIEILAIDDVPVSIHGDYCETLVFAETGFETIARYLERNAAADSVSVAQAENCGFVEVKSQRPLDTALLTELRARFSVDGVRQLFPVLPVLSRRGLQVPFRDCATMQRYNEGRGLSLWELAVCYESERGNMPPGAVIGTMTEMVRVLRRSVELGVAGTQYEDRILGHQSGRFRKLMDEGGLLDGGVLNRIVLYVSALMEVKSAMGVVVAAPTAGACAALPGACIGVADELGLAEEDVAKAMLAAGLIGVFIATRSTFAAEVAGCQAECGAASGMAAAGLVSLMGGSVSHAVAAASLALQNTLGMVCDPVANRVEVPCLGKNVMAASNALACANMALAGYDPVVPLDEVIGAMDAVGRSLPHEVRCTALGGLSVTPASKKIEERLRDE